MVTVINRPTASAAETNGSRRRGAGKAYQTTEEIEIRRLLFDERVNRELQPGHVRHLREMFDLDAIGIITVSERAPRKYVIIDGQHRVRALLDEDMGDWPAICHVYHGLSVADEAKLFRRLNDARKPTAIDDFLKGLTARDEECLAINAIVERVGLKVTKGYGNGRITCVQKLRSIYRGPHGPEVLPLTLHTALSAWGITAEAVEGHLVAGLGEFHRRFHLAEVDHERLIKKLSKFQGGPTGLIGRAKGLREVRPAPVGRCVASIVVDVYNRGHRPENQLPAL